MKTVANVEIFATGTHNGDVYTKDDLDTLVDSFYALKDELKVPVKLGHTSDEWNAELAKKIGVPKEIIDGEEGQGSIALGWLDNVRRKGSKLIADLKQVPEKVAEWIESGLYKAVSCEIWADYKSGDKTYPYALCGLALLGAELPAVRNIEGLDSARVYKAIRPDRVIEWAVPEEGILEGAMVRALRRVFGRAVTVETENPPALEAETIQDKQEDNVKEVALALGLAEDAKLEAILEAITALKGAGEKVEEKAEEKPEEKPVENAEAKAFADEKAALEAKVQTYADENASLRADLKAKSREVRVMQYTEIAKGWTCLAGKPEEFGVKLADAEDIGKDVADILLKTFSEANDRAKAAKITEPIGTPGAVGGKHKFVELVEQRMQDKGMEYAGALNECAREYENLYREWRKSEQ
jgi:hypothetical protein